MIVPAHEQHWPGKLLPHRLQEYVRHDGPPTFDSVRARRATPQEIYDSIRAAQHAIDVHDIDPRYFVGTCFHESNGAINEWDTEVATKSSPDGFVSVGPYQIGREEAQRYNFTLEDMVDLDKASACIVQLAQYNLSQVLAAMALAKQRGRQCDADATERGATYAGGGVRAYLAIAHNHGVGYMRKTVDAYGLDWARYKARNPFDNIVAHSYGADCVTGGSWFLHVRQAA